MGENKKVTIMVLKVDLQCEKCYRKVKKVLCKFPQIRDQTYDEKNNQVIIKVVCCNPEKIRDQLYCKGGCVITSIDFIEPSPVTLPPPAPPVTPPPPPPVKPCPSPVKPCPTPCMCRLTLCTCRPTLCTCLPVMCICSPVPPPVKCLRLPENTCCTDCCRGHPCGPCQTGYRYGVQVYDCYGGWRSYNTRSYCVTRTDCFSEENSQACAIM